MDLIQTKQLLKWLTKSGLDKHIIETFILVLMVDGIESHGKSFMSWKIIKLNITAQIIVILASINMVFNPENH